MTVISLFSFELTFETFITLDTKNGQAYVLTSLGKSEEDGQPKIFSAMRLPAS